VQKQSFCIHRKSGTDPGSPYKFDYINGVLEEVLQMSLRDTYLRKMGLKEHAVQIIEGGADTFKKNASIKHKSSFNMFGNPPVRATKACSESRLYYF